MVDFSLYLITDRTQTAGRELPAVVADALAGGVTCLQLREKDLLPRQLFDCARQMRHLTRLHGARLLINDRLDVALAVDADGAHLGRNSLPIAEARRILGPERLIGYSAHAVDEALQAERDGADFVTIGPMFFTPSKAVYGEPLGVGLLEEVVARLSIPVFALGGVKKASIPQIMATGCRGVALISAVMAADDPAGESRSILSALEHHVRNV